MGVLVLNGRIGKICPICFLENLSELMLMTEAECILTGDEEEADEY